MRRSGSPHLPWTLRTRAQLAPGSKFRVRVLNVRDPASRSVHTARPIRQDGPRRVPVDHTARAIRGSAAAAGYRSVAVDVPAGRDPLPVARVALAPVSTIPSERSLGPGLTVAPDSPRPKFNVTRARRGLAGT